MCHLKETRQQPVRSGTLLLTALGIFFASICAAQTPSSAPRKPTRPPLEKRKFTSAAVEKEIVRVTGLIADPETAWIFQACYPNTLDTTVNFTTAGGRPDTYIITGDINAMWLRDSAAQVQGYLPLCKQDLPLAQMVAGLIHHQAACILLDPYANAFMQDASKPSPHARDRTDMRPGVFQRDWELDSLCYCIRLGYEYWKVTGDRGHVRRRLVEGHAPGRNDHARAAAENGQRPLPLRRSAGQCGLGTAHQAHGHDLHLLPRFRRSLPVPFQHPGQPLCRDRPGATGRDERRHETRRRAGRGVPRPGGGGAKGDSERRHRERSQTRQNVRVRV